MTFFRSSLMVNFIAMLLRSKKRVLIFRGIMFADFKLQMIVEEVACYHQITGTAKFFYGLEWLRQPWDKSYNELFEGKGIQQIILKEEIRSYFK